MATTQHLSLRPVSPGKMLDCETELASPEYLEAEIAHLCAIADRYGMPVSLAACRIRIPDSLPSNGDFRVMTDRIADCLRLPDTASRWSADVVLILLPNTVLPQAERVSQRIAGSLLSRPLPSGATPFLYQAEIQHSPGEDPMMTVAALEGKLASACETQKPVC